MFALTALAWLALAAAVPASDNNKGTVKLTLYYEAYCPYCITFLGSQVVPASQQFGEHLSIDLLPFGNAKQRYEDGHFKFSCQHGHRECLANKLHACAIEQACGGGSLGCPQAKLAKVILYIQCVIQRFDQHERSDKCAQDAGLDSESIDQCAAGELGEKLLSGYGNRTAAFQPQIPGVPFIGINDKFDNKTQADAYEDLKKVIRKYIPSQRA